MRPYFGSRWARVCPGRLGLAGALLALLLGAPGAMADGAGPGPSAASKPEGVTDRPEARPSDLDALVKGLQARYERLRDFKARFVQQSLLEAAGSTRIARGEVFFQKPGKMRWNYESPEPQQIVIRDGKLSQYVPADKQVVIQALDTGRVEFAFLTGLGELETQFEIEWANPRRRSGDPLEYVELRPRDPEASFAKVVLGVKPEGHQILATEVEDFLGNVTSLRFEDMRDNVGLDAGLFTLDRPKGVDVIDMTGGAPSS